MRKPAVGSAVPRREGYLKVTGQARFIDDISFPDMLHGITVRSTCARGRLNAIRFLDGVPWNEFTIVTVKDIPGKNCVAHILKDQPCLVDNAINHAEEPVVLLAHADKSLLEKARRLVELDVEPLPAVLSIEDSLKKEILIWGNDNILSSCKIEKGNVDDVWGKADYIVEGEYTTGAQEHLYIENQGVIATANPDDGVTVWGSMQCPYFVHHALVEIFPLPKEKRRVVQTETGGAFGGKEDYPSMLAAHAALLAWKSGKPVKLTYDRSEDMAATTKRHPSKTKICTAIDHDGKLLGMQVDFVLDGGAYSTMSPVVLMRGALHTQGPYYYPNIRITATAVATNAPPHGAFRGFGAPQAFFALERHMDKIAKKIGLSPEELRRRNFIREGQTTATGQVIREKIDMNALLDKALELSQYQKKKERFLKHNKKRGPKKGIGLAAFMHGSGFTGAGEKRIASIVEVEATREGRVRVLVSSTELGQGTTTILSQIAADTLELKTDMIEVAQPDTAVVPDSGPTVASRTVMIVGKLVQSAAAGLRDTLINEGLLSTPYNEPQFKKACKLYLKEHDQLKSISRYEQPPDLSWNQETCQGDAYAAYSWAVYVAEVSMDPVTYGVTVDKFTTIQEVGKVINPVLATGQVQGGVAQGIGYALYENVAWKDGRMANNQMSGYIIASAQDLPPIDVEFEEIPGPHGPYGAKGIGELPMNGVAPAILNAVENATGVSFTHIPLLPETIMEAMKD